MPRRHAARPFTALAAAGAVAVLLAGCGGGSNGGAAAPDDAKASCAALARSKAQLAKPDAATIRRLNAAANLGIASSGDKKYASLAAPMNALLSDVSTANFTKAATDTRAALSICSDLKLPH